MSQSPCLGILKGKALFVLTCTVLTFFNTSNAEQYYEPKYRRYVFIGEEPAKIKHIRNTIDSSNQQYKEESITPNSQVKSYRKFDPNRYHNTEDIDFL